MATRRVGLNAPPGALFNGFETGSHLTGQRWSKAEAGRVPVRETYVDALGRPVAGDDLNTQLENLGDGWVILTVEGQYVASPSVGGNIRELQRWSRRERIFIGKGEKPNAATLGREVHRIIREFREKELTKAAKATGATGRARKKDSPPEMYVQSISLRTEGGAKPSATAKRVRTVKDKKTGKPVIDARSGAPRVEVVRPRVFYVDTKTGKWVTKEKYERSRAAIRGKTKRGHKAKAGRYVKRIR